MANDLLAFSVDEPLRRMDEHVNAKTSIGRIPLARKRPGKQVTTTVSRRSTLFTRFALAAISVLVFVWLSVNVVKNDTSRVDDYIRNLVHRTSQPALTEAMKVASYIGEAGNVQFLTLAVVVAFWIQGRRRDGLVLAVTILGAGVLGNVLKLCFHRARPVPHFGLAIPATFSFPSEHALMTICFYGVLVHLTNSHVQSVGIRAGIWAVAVSMTLVIGFSRIYLGLHYPTDVVAGYAAGAAWVSAITLAERFAPRFLARPST